MHNVFVISVICVFSSFMYLKALNIFKKFNYKRDISRRLVEKSKKHYDQRYFLPYMDTLCMRSVVYFALREIDRADEYGAIKRRAWAERNLFEAPRVVKMINDEDGQLVYLTHDRVTGEIEKI